MLWALPSHVKEESFASMQEEKLIQLAGHQGKEEAFAELVRRHQGAVRGLLMRLTDDPYLADDLAQEAFLRAYRGLIAFAGRAKFSTWLYRIAYNLFLNHRSRVRPTSTLPDGFSGQTVASEPHSHLAQTDLRRDLGAAISSLPQHYRAVVVLYYLEDVTYPEICQILNLPLGTVKTHLHRAKKLLRTRLHGWEREKLSHIAE